MVLLTTSLNFMAASGTLSLSQLMVQPGFLIFSSFLLENDIFASKNLGSWSDSQFCCRIVVAFVIHLQRSSCLTKNSSISCHFPVLGCRQVPGFACLKEFAQHRPFLLHQFIRSTPALFVVPKP